jgi:uncharacterized repeat protein (TIGR01451 family)
LTVEAMESRRLLSSTFIVTNTTDNTAPGSLRWAIGQANASAGSVIDFQIPGAGAQTIALTAALPTLSVPMVIDGTTQPGYTGSPLIELNGSGAGSNVDGLDVAGGNTTIQGLAINRFSGEGIKVLTAGTDTIQLNYIGTDPTGTINRGNTLDGVFVGLNANNNKILNNVISGNAANGIYLNANVFGASNPATTGNVIQGNLIGLTASGSAGLGNKGYGVNLNDAPHTLIGGNSAATRNIISANTNGGVDLGPGDFSIVSGNFIGTDITGSLAVGSGPSGVQPKGVIFTGGSNDTIGGTTPGAGNVISGNSGNGIDSFVIGSSNETIQGNLVGTDVTGTKPLGNGADGIYVTGPTTVLIGGTSPGAGNVVANNGNIGIDTFSKAVNYTIQGNLIGTDVTGTVAMGNKRYGIFIWSPSNVTIGGTTASARNIISNNGSDGIGTFASGQSLTIQGNLIGTDITGGTAMGNSGAGINATFPNVTIGGTAPGAGNVIANNGFKDAFDHAGVIVTAAPVSILSNSIYGNNNLGINVTSSVPASQAVAAPVLASVTSTTSTLFQGSVTGNPNTQYIVQFFSNLAVDNSGFAEGQTFLGQAAVTTDSSGNGTINATLPVVVGNGLLVDATATNNASGATSVFSTAVATVGPTTSADLAVTITSSAFNIIVGQPLSYTVTVSNLGPNDANGVVLTDILPASVTFVSAGVTQGAAPTSSGGSVIANFGIVPAGTVARLTINVATKGATPPSVTDTASVTSLTPDLNPLNNATSNTTIVANAADLSVAMVANPSPVPIDQNLTYVVSVTNNGPTDAGSVVLSDVLPANVSFVSASSSQGSIPIQTNGTVTANLGTVANGTTATVTIIVVPMAPAIPSITNNASVSSSTLDPNPNNNLATLTTTVLPIADLSVSIVPPTTNVPATATATFVTPTTITFAITSGGTGYVSPPTVTLTGGGGTFTSVTAAVSGGAVTGITLTGAAGFTSAPTVTIAPPPSANQVGRNMTYTFSVTNNGPYAATGVTLTDVLPANLSFVLATSTKGTVPIDTNGTLTADLGVLAVGETETVSLTVDPTPGAPPSVSDTVTVTSQTPDPTLSNNTATNITLVAPIADVAVALTSSVDTIQVGQALTYTLVVTNNGPNIATGVTLTDTLPNNVTFNSASTSQGALPTQSAGVVTDNLGTLTVGSTATVLIVVTPTKAAASLIADVAVVTANESDSNQSNNNATVTTPVVPAADIAVTLTPPTGPVQVGQNLTYTLNATNFGPSDAASVLLDDTLPPGLSYVSATASQGAVPILLNGTVIASLGTIPAGSNATLTVVATATKAAAATVTDTATVSSQTLDPSPDNNTATAQTTIVPAADLALSLTGSASPAQLGQDLIYTLNVTNNGPSDATGVSLVDTLPVGASYVPTTTYTGATLSPNGNILTANLGIIPAGTTATVTIDLTTSLASLPSTSDSARVTANEIDPDPTNNSASLTTNVTPTADLGVTVTPSVKSVQVGNKLTYTINVVNNGLAPASNVTLTDLLPASVSFDSGSIGTIPILAPSGHTLTLNLGTMPSQASAIVTLTVLATTELPSTITNQVSVASQTLDPDTTNNTANTATTVTAQADLALGLTGTTSAQVGQNLVYTINVSNSGPNEADGVVLSDALPAGVTFVSATATQGPTPTPTGNVVTASLGTIASGGSATVTITAKAGPNAAPTVTNKPTVASQTTDPNTANNTESLTTTVTPLSDVSVKITASATAIKVGDNLTYSAVITNSGPSPATNVTFTDPLPAGLNLISSTSTAGAQPTLTDGTLSAAIGTMTSGTTAVVTIIVNALPAAYPSLANAVSVSATQTDPNTANNTSSVTTSVAPVDVLAALAAPGLPTTTAGQTLSAVQVAAFRDSNPSATVSRFSATINWGDGSSSLADEIVPNGSGGFNVFGSHTYSASSLTHSPQAFSVTTTVTAVGAASIQTLNQAIVKGASPTVSGQLTSAGKQPSFAGTTKAGATVVVMAQPTSGGSPSAIAQTTASSSGTWSATAQPLSDGKYIITAVATDNLGQTGSTTILPSSQPLLVDTTGPRVTAVVFNRAAGQLVITLQDNASGLDQGSLNNVSNYSFIQQGKRGAKNLVTGVSTLQPSDRTAPQTVTLTIKGGKSIRSGSFALAITSGAGTSGIHDAAGNPLDGEFQGSFPSGNGSPGGNFTAVVKPANRAVVPARAVTPATSGHTPAQILAAHDAVLGAIHVAKSRHHRHK